MTQALPNQRRYAIVGTGALGGYYGAKLQQSGQEVHFLLHRDYEQVASHGLRIDSCDGDFQLPHVKAYQDPVDMPPCDVVIVALKALHNHLLPHLVPPILAESGVVLLLQNGLGGEEVVANSVGPHRVAGGLCFIGSNKIGPGHIRHVCYGSIQIGDYTSNYQPQPVSRRLQQIAQDFEQAGIPIQLTEDLLQARWQKLVWNIPFNGLSVIFRTTTDHMIQDSDTRTLVQHLMTEVQQAATACGHPIPDDAPHQMMTLTENMTLPYSTSMKLDYERHHPLEVEAIFGIPLRRAEAAGAYLPRISTLYHQLKMLDKLNRFDQ